MKTCKLCGIKDIELEYGDYCAVCYKEKEDKEK